MHEEFRKAGFTGRQARKLANDPHLKEHPDAVEFVRFLVKDAQLHRKLKPAEARKVVFNLLVGPRDPMKLMKIRRPPGSKIQLELLQPFSTTMTPEQFAEMLKRYRGNPELN